VVDIPPVPAHAAHLITQVVQPRPRPRPTYRLTVPTADVTNAEEIPNGHDESRPSMGGVPGVAGVDNGIATAAETQNAAVNERRYPRRSNRTNLQFKIGIDV
jgi:hypothetical protein